MRRQLQRAARQLRRRAVGHAGSTSRRGRRGTGTVTRLASVAFAPTRLRRLRACRAVHCHPWASSRNLSIGGSVRSRPSRRRPSAPSRPTGTRTVRPIDGWPPGAPPRAMSSVSRRRAPPLAGPCARLRSVSSSLGVGSSFARRRWPRVHRRGSMKPVRYQFEGVQRAAARADDVGDPRGWGRRGRAAARRRGARAISALVVMASPSSIGHAKRSLAVQQASIRPPLRWRRPHLSLRSPQRPARRSSSARSALSARRRASTSSRMSSGQR